MSETIRIDDMRLFAKVAEAKGFTAAARALGMPKQTVSRRIAELERSLGVRLLHRTTRRMQLTRAGAAYAERCAEIVRIAEDANRAAVDDRDVPRGTLRITADPVFGEAYLTDLVVAYAKAWPEVRMDVVLTRRRVDLLEEGFDVAFRIGEVDDATLSGFALGPARVRYCASPAYLASRGTPQTPDDLARHDCLVVASDGTHPRWPFRGATGVRAVPVAGRLVVTSFAMAHAAALAGLGIAIFPEFAAAADVRRGRLRAVLDAWVVEVGKIWVLHAARRSLPARVRTFVELARARFTRSLPKRSPSRARPATAPSSSRARRP
jgi:DNA-binding transcriptional LysR family regulator